MRVFTKNRIAVWKRVRYLWLPSDSVLGRLSGVVRTDESTCYRRNRRDTVVPMGCTILLENAGDRYSDRPIRTGMKA